MALLEICCGDIESVNTAIRSGADRIELCSSLETGGLTPSPGLTEGALWRSSLMDEPIPVNILVRPRGGDFLYTDRELRVCCQDAAWAAQAGAAGLVFGALTRDGEIDEEACRMLLDALRRANLQKRPSLTFHRAFDLCRDPFEALEVIIGLGFDRILTSGLAPDSLSGAELIARLREKAAGRILIMPGGGVTPSNISEILSITGATEIHASAKCMKPSRMRFHRDDISLGSDASDSYPSCDPVIATSLVELAHQS